MTESWQRLHRAAEWVDWFGRTQLQNGKTVEEILRESYVDGLTVANPLIPDDEELPKLLDRVYPCHEIVKIDGFLPGCPPKADLFWDALHLLMSGKSLHEISFRNVRYD